MFDASRAIKIVLLGDAHVGKTCLLSKWCQGQFQREEPATVGVGFTRKAFAYAGATYELHVWDTAGQECFQSLAPIYSQNAHGALLVVDLTRFETLANLDKWRGFLNAPRDDVAIVIAGNKVDLEAERQIGFDAATAAAERINAQYFETSAMSGAGVNNAFDALAEASINASIAVSSQVTGLPPPGHTEIAIAVEERRECRC